jgi:hypothetical protein
MYEPQDGPRAELNPVAILEPVSSERFEATPVQKRPVGAVLIGQVNLSLPIHPHEGMVS